MFLFGQKIFLSHNVEWSEHQLPAASTSCCWFLWSFYSRGSKIGISIFFSFFIFTAKKDTNLPVPACLYLHYWQGDPVKRTKLRWLIYKNGNKSFTFSNLRTKISKIGPNVPSPLIKNICSAKKKFFFLQGREWRSVSSVMVFGWGTR